jgi:hypothetical protein
MVRVDPELVGPGERIVVDVVQYGAIGGMYNDKGEWVRPTLQLRQTERITAVPDDLGVVTRERDGAVIGHVEEAIGRVITISYTAGMDPGAPPACERCGCELGPDPTSHYCTAATG